MTAFIHPRAPHLRCLQTGSERRGIHLPARMDVAYMHRAVPVALATLLVAAVLLGTLSACSCASPQARRERAYDYIMANPIDEFEGMPEHAWLKTDRAGL